MNFVKEITYLGELTKKLNDRPFLLRGPTPVMLTTFTGLTVCMGWAGTKKPWLGAQLVCFMSLNVFLLDISKKKLCFFAGAMVN
jgi:hypothetical protein